MRRQFAENRPKPEASRRRQRANSVAAGVPCSIRSNKTRALSSGTPLLSISARAEATCARLASLKAGRRQRSTRRRRDDITATDRTATANPKSTGAIQMPTNTKIPPQSLSNPKSCRTEALMTVVEMRDKQDNRNAPMKTIAG